MACSSQKRAGFGRGDDLGEGAVELRGELGRGLREQAVGHGTRLVLEARAAGVLPALVGPGLSEARAPQVAHVPPGVRFEEVVAAEAELLDEVDGQRVTVHGHALEEPGHHAEHLVGDDELLERHLLHAVEEAGAEQEVGAGEELEQQARGVLVGRLRPGLFGLGPTPAEAGRHPVVAGHLRLRGAQQQGFGHVGEVGAGAHEQGRRPARVHDLRPRAGELHRGDGGEDLGVVDDGGAGRRHRRRRPEDRHGVEHHGDAGLGEREGEVHAEALLVERAHGAEDDRERGPRLELG